MDDEWLQSLFLRGMDIGEVLDLTRQARAELRYGGTPRFLPPKIIADHRKLIGQGVDPRGRARASSSVDRTYVRECVKFASRWEALVAFKIVHATLWQQVRFGDRATAERYAVQYGGLEVWRVLTIPQEDAAGQHRTKGHHVRHH